MKFDGIDETIEGLRSCSVGELPEVLAKFSENCVDIEDKAQLAIRFASCSFPDARHGCSSVAMYYHRLHNGGIEREVSLLANMLNRAGYRVVVITDELGDGDYSLNEGIARESLDLAEGLSRHDAVFSRLEKLKRIIHDCEVDVFVNHAWLMSDMIFDLLLCRMLSVRYVVNAHGVFSFPLISSHFDGALFSVLPRLLSLCNGVVTQTEVSAAFFGKFCSSVHVIPNCVDYSQYQDAKSASWKDAASATMLWVGRFDEYKQPLDAIDVLKHVRAMGLPSAKLVFVGKSEDGVYEKHLQARAREHGLEDAVCFEGFQSDVDEYYALADLMIMTSAVEGFSMVLLEASAAALPTVMYELPYLSFRNSAGVASVDMGDVEAAAREAVRILSNRDAWERMSRGARACYERFAAYDYEAAWARVLEGVDSEMRLEDEESLMWETLLDHYAQGIRLGRLATQWDRDQAVNAVRSEYEESVSYRLGRALTSVPRRLWDGQR